MRDTVRIYLPAATPVQAAAYTDPGALDDIKRWVEQLRRREHIGPGISFTIAEDADGTPVGRIDDAARSETVTLQPTDFLVFGRGRLRVLSQADFHRDYRDVSRSFL